MPYNTCKNNAELVHSGGGMKIDPDKSLFPNSFLWFIFSTLSIY